MSGKSQKEEKPDLIILDLMLPKMDGCKVCGLLKSDVRYNKIPIIMFTARAQFSPLTIPKICVKWNYVFQID